MRFTNDVGLLQTLKYSAQRLTRILTVPITNGYRKLRRVLNPNGFTTRVMGDVRKGSKELIGGKPQSLKDYFSFGNYYVAKKLVYLLLIALLVLPVLYLKFLHPVIRATFFTTTIPVNSVDMVGYSGKVRLLYQPGGGVLYHGPLVEGRITGEGRLYDQEANLLYQGSFLMEQYEGRGQEFWPSGKVRYTGDFADNRYEGRGILYDEAGVLLYDGSFAAGVYSGSGALYEDGRVLYFGSFENGQMSGAGKLYSGRTVIYDGSFAGGVFEGPGREYDPVGGQLIYDGAYAAGRYEGQGKRYDAQTGKPVYEGGFSQGLYSGDGKLYDPLTQQPLYEGGFRDGRFDGEGVAYDAELGAAVYRGGFLLGAYHGTGTEYDPATGFVVAAGEYRNGELVVLGPDGAVLPPEGDAAADPGAAGTTGTGGQTGGQTGGNQADGGDQAGNQTGETPATKPGGGGAKAYAGPTTADGSVDFTALAKLSAAQAKAQFTIRPDSWTVSGEQVQVYSDKTEGLGLALRTDSSGKTVSVDVWNDAAVYGAKTGMSKAELSAALGKPTKTGQETIGAGRMFSISQSNRYFGRLTNLSPDSKVTVHTYQTAGGTVQAVFAGKQDQCLLLEILP